MNAGKSISLPQLQSESLALGGTHATHGMTSYGVDPNQDVRCVDSSGTVIDLCATAQQALSAYTPAASPATQITPAVGAGTGATVVLHQLNAAVSTDVHGIMDIIIGTNPTAGSNGHYPLALVTFGTPLTAAPIVAVVNAVGANAITLGFVVGDLLKPTSFTIIAQNAPVAGQTYRLNYNVN